MNKQTIYITGEARTTIDNAITKMFGTFYIAFEIILSTDEIIDVDCNATLRLTRDFVNRLFLNHNIIKDEEMLKKEVTKQAAVHIFFILSHSLGYDSYCVNIKSRIGAVDRKSVV